MVQIRKSAATGNLGPCQEKSEDLRQFVGWLSNLVEKSERCENRRFRKSKGFDFTGSLRFERHWVALLKLHRGRNHSESDELCHDGARFSLYGLRLWLGK